jgi:formylmethanofuran dehydrogenase subunit B
MSSSVTTLGMPPILNQFPSSTIVKEFTEDSIESTKKTDTEGSTRTEKNCNFAQNKLKLGITCVEAHNNLPKQIQMMKKLNWGTKLERNRTKNQPKLKENER